MTCMEPFFTCFNRPTSPLHINVWDHPLSLPRPSGGNPVMTIDLFSNLKFDGEGRVSAFMHLNQFNIAY